VKNFRKQVLYAFNVAKSTSPFRRSFEKWC
jgi:hypothetical protein